MIPYLGSFFNWRRTVPAPKAPAAGLHDLPAAPLAPVSADPPPPTPILALAHDRPSALTALVELPPQIATCPTTVAAWRLVRDLPWAAFPERDESAPKPGPKPHPRAAFVAVFLLKLEQQLPTMGHLRRWLIDHPALLWLLGFQLVPDPTHPLGFHPGHSAPKRRQLSRVLRSLDQDALTWLLQASVQLIQATLPPDEAATMGDLVAGDTKHIIGWVKENNPNRHAPARADKTVQPPGDPDCRLGVKTRRTRERPVPATPTTESQPASQKIARTEAYWGYASGIVVTPTSGGTVVLAELTQPFNASDMSYFRPLMAQTEAVLGRRPSRGTWDKAFDSQEVYAYFADGGGFAAIPLNPRGQAPLSFTEDGRLCCAAGIGMTTDIQFWDRTSWLHPQLRQRYRCPLLVPEVTGDPCPVDHARFPQGGCIRSCAAGVGPRARWELDRSSELFRATLRQRGLVEQVNSQAKALGIERPKLRNGDSVAHQNTLLYVLLNLRTMHRMRGTFPNLHA